MELEKYKEFMQDFGSISWDDRFTEAISTCFQKKLSNNNIKVYSFCGASAGLEFTYGSAEGTSNLLFVNDVYYGTVRADFRILGTVTVPDNIEDTDEAYINYAKPKIEKFLGKSNITINKISSYWFDVQYDGCQYLTNAMIIKKADGAPVSNYIYVNGLEKDVYIKATTTENAEMENELRNKGYTNILGSYEMELHGADKLTSSVDITFIVGKEHNNKTVLILHKKKDGNYENFERVVENGKVTITVSELSPFMIALKEETQQAPDITQEQNQKDETPKTGIETDNNIMLYVINLIIVVGIIALINKKH